MSGIIEVERRKMAQHLGYLVENIAIDYILANHKSLIKKAYPDQSDMNCVQVMRTNPHAHNGYEIGKITGNKQNRVIHGWNGDLVLVFNDKERGKRAVIFEIKFGRVHLSKPQHEFFQRASVEVPSNFMPKLNGLKVFIINCYSLDVANGTVEFRMYEYMSPNAREYFRPVSTKSMPKATPKRKAKPKKKEKKKSKKKRRPEKMRRGIRKNYRDLKRTGAIWGWDGSDE